MRLSRPLNRTAYGGQENPDFLLVKRCVPEHEQDKLWEHTRRLRESRKSYRGLGDGRPSRVEMPPDDDVEIRIRRRDKLEEAERGDYSTPHSRPRSPSEIVIHRERYTSGSSRGSDVSLTPSNSQSSRLSMGNASGEFLPLSISPLEIF